jgi:hypothetical protein
VGEAARLKPGSGSAVDRNHGICWTVENIGRFGKMISSLLMANAALTPMKLGWKVAPAFQKIEE